jgi:hypothetical protein
MWVLKTYNGNGYVHAIDHRGKIVCTEAQWMAMKLTDRGWAGDIAALLHARVVRLVTKKPTDVQRTDEGQ